MPRREVLESWATIIGGVSAAIACATVVISAVKYFGGDAARERAAIERNWEVLIRMEGRTGDGARKAAIEDLADRGIPLDGIILDHAVIPSLSLKGASILRTSARFARLDGADLSEAGVSNSDLKNASLDRSQLVGTEFRDVHADSLVLNDSDASHFRATGLRAEDLISNGTAFDSARFELVWLRGGIFDNSELTFTEFYGAAMDSASFRRAHLSHGLLLSSDLKGADFRTALANRLRISGRSDLSEARFDQACLPRLEMNNVVARGVSFFSAHLGGAVFTDTDLREANFTSADLRDAVFERCNVEGASFEGALTVGVQFIDVEGLPVSLDTPAGQGVGSGWQGPPSVYQKEILAEYCSAQREERRGRRWRGS